MNKNSEIAKLLHYKELVRQLVLKDIKLKYRRSYLGYIWSILNPLLMMFVLVIVFSNIFRFDIPNYAVYLLTGQVVFSFFAEATNMAITSITGNAVLLKKAYVPKSIFVLSKVTSSLINFLFSLVALLLVMIVTQHPINENIFYFPIVLIELYLFSLGIGFFLAAFSVFFRDIQYLWGVFISIWMYLTPIFYPASIIEQQYQWMYQNLNPMYGYLQQFRDIVMNGKMPDNFFLLQGIVISLISLLVGIYFFKRNQDKFILYI